MRVVEDGFLIAMTSRPSSRRRRRRPRTRAEELNARSPSFVPNQGIDAALQAGAHLIETLDQARAIPDVAYDQ